MIERKHTTSQQQLRTMALRAQLLAVDAQAEALRCMDREHTLGVESSLQVNFVRTDVHDFMNDVFALVKKSAEVPLEETRGGIAVMLERAKNLKAEADKLRDCGKRGAQFRYSTHAPDAAFAPVADPGCSPPDAGVGAVPPTPQPVPVTTEKLQAKADFACLRAEVDEYAAFAMQVHALCNLALEYCYTAGADSSRSEGNI